MGIRRIFMILALLFLSSSVFAQAGRYAVGKKIAEDPSILTESWFWVIVIIGLGLVGIYYIVKDKDE